ncbi:fluoride efflux transporter CrcB [Aneurinibacillus thermoaerophilus]|uniref:Fluoride-specific ion channel FluC n=2 Tax=Aneurinibacillus thermoaerophilus TaxID=143495 RepID=A0A1G7YWS3_ANETH|nr:MULTISPECIES: fluoride efflux transporter CrcB [Aneurinibacillus]MED0674417.1 fluoride efflux transporter CrcB [Aneurinibacillus thermoaerophilus]MED0758958.1 fluoride efflux transporter CrcB [Aneurinibacillus thermoaerophilus]MED0761016.1 fluoride efflux transporter CrcB [Aneurinibacillus thermoaerophilus]SDH00963.1 camphor resistance protein CrcB [Aneurinibacillus thermoaerophilus]
MMDVVWVAVGGFIGAISRFIVVNIVNKWTDSSFPYGTLTVNIVGSFLLGFLYGADVDWQMSVMFGTGFLGSFTTFSTFQYEIFQLKKLKKHKEMVWYIGSSIIIGIIAAAIGFQISHSSA